VSATERLVADLRVLVELIDDGRPVRFISGDLLAECADEIEQLEAKRRLWKNIAEGLSRRLADDPTTTTVVIDDTKGQP